MRVAAIATVIADLAEPPADAADAYLRLHLLSHRLIRPHGANLDGIFGVLPNVAWTSAGPGRPGRAATRVRLRFRAAGRPLAVYGVDKFPRMVDYVVPSGVRIADADRVRLGAHLAEGTTVMHEGFVQLQRRARSAPRWSRAASARASWSATASDIGGGASIMGTLSGRRHRGDLDRRALPDRRQRRPRASRSATTAPSRPGST